MPELPERCRYGAGQSRLGPARAGFGIGVRESWEQALRDVEAAGGKPYAIPAGASDHSLGGLGFARRAHEVAQRDEELGVFVDKVIICSVTGPRRRAWSPDYGRSRRRADGGAG